MFQKYTDIASFNTIFLSVKIFDFLNKSKQMRLLSNTLYRAREDTLYFIVIFITLMLGFVGLSYLSFGSSLAGYSTIPNAILSCFEMALGYFNYEDLSNVTPVMAAIFFFPFNILFIFILINIFIAIIN